MLAYRLLGSFPGAPGVPTADILNLTVEPEGGWLPIAMSSPRAVFADNKTFFGYIDGTNGKVKVAAWDHDTASLIGPVTLNPTFAIDDHNAPAILVRNEDDRLVMLYCSQASPGSIRKVISANPLDITNWSSESSMVLGGSNYLYTTLLQMATTGPNRMYLYWKDFPSVGTTRMREATSSNGGSSFTGSTIIWQSTNAYWVIASDGLTRIDYICTDSAPSDSVNNIYHFYQDTSLGQLYFSDGTPLTTPATPANATLIYNGAESMWPYSITYTGDGRPVVACATQEANPKYRDLRYISGTTWQESLITASGTGGFFGTQAQGIAHDGANRVLLGKAADGGYEMFEYVSGDDGQTWTGTQITSGSGSDLPNAPAQVKDHGPLAFLWVTGTYTSSADFSFRTLGLP